MNKRLSKEEVELLNVVLERHLDNITAFMRDFDLVAKNIGFQIIENEKYNIQIVISRRNLDYSIVNDYINNNF